VMWFNVMGTDGIPGQPLDRTLGQFSLDGHGKMALKYASGSPVDHPVFGKIEEILRAMAKEMGPGAEYTPFPLWGGLFGKRKLVVTHPLGGCPMGHTSTDGAVDTQGRVFKTANGGTDVHPGLFVMDGSVLPGPVAVNPTLTIVAVALRTLSSVIDYLGGATAKCPRKT